MKTGVIVSVAIAIIGIVGLVLVFVQSASPYVTVAAAKTNPAKVHVVGQLVKESLEQDPRARVLKFTLRDDSGVMPVRYKGAPQAGLSTADKIVVIGSMKDGEFHSDQMLLKCPSKYESEPGKST